MRPKLGLCQQGTTAVALAVPSALPTIILTSVAKLERNRGGCDYKEVTKNSNINTISMVKTIKIGKKYIMLPLIVIKSAFLHFHEATNHGLIRDFHHFFFLHIANKTIAHKLITDAVA